MLIAKGLAEDIFKLIPNKLMSYIVQQRQHATAAAPPPAQGGVGHTRRMPDYIVLLVKQDQFSLVTQAIGGCLTVFLLRVTRMS